MPIDFSDVTGAVIEEARQLARARQARTLLRAARQGNPLAVVIGAHARGRLHDVLSTGIRRSLLRERARPVLVVPAARARGGRRSAQ